MHTRLSIILLTRKCKTQGRSEEAGKDAPTYKITNLKKQVQKTSGVQKTTRKNNRKNKGAENKYRKQPHFKPF